MALTPKHQEFINQYIACYFNATEAYKRVYPKSSDDAARAHGARLVANGNVAAEINRRIAERVMGPDEVLVRFTEQARAEYSQYFMPNGTVDLAKLIRDGKTHLIKSVKETKYGTNVEFYDAHSAKELIGKHHKLFADKVEHSGSIDLNVVKGYVSISPDDWDQDTTDSDL